MISENKFIYALRLAAFADVGIEFSKKEAQELAGMIDGYLASIAELDGEIAKMKKYFHKPAHGTCCTCQKCGHTYDECRCDFDEALDDLDKANARIAELEAERRWRVVANGELPGLGKEVIFYDSIMERRLKGCLRKNGGVEWLSDEGYAFSSRDGRYSRITHWMPLPTPPEVQE